jgi:hAT family C-terminal dimerisation region
VAEERNTAVPELRTLLLESESESIVGGSEMAYSRRRRQRRAKTDALRALTIPPGRCPRGPPLSNWAHCRQLAFDLLSIPAMSAEVERIFISAKRTITAELKLNGLN